MKVRKKLQSKSFKMRPLPARDIEVPKKTRKNPFVRVWQYITSAIIVSILLFILVNFYIFSSIISVDTFFLIFLALTLLTDGIFLVIHLLRKPIKHPQYSCDPSKVSAVIACYNGAEEIGQTIEHLKRHIPKDQIFIVSDASTDNTVAVARSYGVRVIENTENVNKAFSVSIGVHAVKTPYVLILDDDVLIGDAVIPTSLLDEGYSAVAFNVLPIKTDTFVNALQMFEYRVSMYIGKNLRASASAVGNVSGAIGLFKTKDLKDQAYLHSGQFAGEDEQRTILSHIYGSGKGVTYSEETVQTHVPNTFHALYRQRAYGWNLSVPELIPLYLRILFSPDYHYLLKSEKAYNLYLFLTDPLRLLFLWTLLLRPRYLVLTYGLYLILNIAMWLKTKHKDQFLVVLLYPFYTLLLGVFRHIGNFYWFKVKFVYFKKRFHRRVYNRFIVAEALMVALLFVGAWGMSVYHFSQEMSIFNKVRSSRLEDNLQNFDYDSEQAQQLTDINNLNITFSKIQPSPGTYIGVELEKGDTLRAIAHKTVEMSTDGNVNLTIPYDQRYMVDLAIAKLLQDKGGYLNSATSTLLIDSTSVMQTITNSLENPNAQAS